MHSRITGRVNIILPPTLPCHGDHLQIVVSHSRLAFTSKSIGTIRSIRSRTRLSRTGSMMGIMGAGVVLCSGASETTTCERSGCIRFPEMMLSIPHTHSSLHAVSHTGVCTTPVRSTAIASSQHACSHAPQKVHRSGEIAIFLSSGMYHAFAGQTLKHAWHPSGSHFMRRFSISRILPSNGLKTSIAS